jgi:hypothetical protein
MTQDSRESLIKKKKPDCKLQTGLFCAQNKTTKIS